MIILPLSPKWFIFICHINAKKSTADLTLSVTPSSPSLAKDTSNPVGAVGGVVSPASISSVGDPSLDLSSQRPGHLVRSSVMFVLPGNPLTAWSATVPVLANAEEIWATMIKGVPGILETSLSSVENLFGAAVSRRRKPSLRKLTKGWAMFWMRRFA